MQKKYSLGLRKIFMDKLKNTFIHYIVKLLFSLPKQQEKLQLPVTQQFLDLNVFLVEYSSHSLVLACFYVFGAAVKNAENNCHLFWKNQKKRNQTK